MSHNESSWPEPYRILFPLGALASLVGVSLWLLFSKQLIQFYPRQAHANVMYFAFLWSFIAGFLMTAIPKMTQTKRAGIFEMSIAVLLVLGQLGFSFIDSFKGSVLLVGVQTLFLVGFVGRRFLVKKQIPFEGFLYIPFAFVQCFLAIFLVLKEHQVSIDVYYLLVGEAFILNLILGLGSRLIPVLSRVPNALAPDAKAQEKKWLIVALTAVSLNLGFWLQGLGYFYAGILLRLAVILWIAVKEFKVLTPTPVRSYVAWGLRCGVFFIVISHVLAVVDHSRLLTYQHLLYVGGFVLITFMVGTRVMLAHGGEDLKYETDSKRIGFVALFLAIASLLRLYAESRIFGATLKWAILFFILAILLWTQKFFKILLKRKSL